MSDPIYLWNNSGNAGSSWGVGSAWSSQVQQGRDIFVNSGAKPGVPGSGGTAWAKYKYPHPLRAAVEGGGSQPTPTPQPTPTATPTPQPTPTPPVLSFALSWNSVANAAKYQVFEDGSQIAEQTATTYSLAGKVGPKTYTVRGVNSDNVAGPQSNQVSLPAPTPTPTPTPVPTPPPTPTPKPTPAAPVLELK